MGYPKKSPTLSKAEKAIIDEMLGSETSMILSEAAPEETVFMFIRGVPDSDSTLVQPAGVKRWMLESYRFYGVFRCENMDIILNNDTVSAVNATVKSGITYERIPVYRSSDPEDPRFYTIGGIQEKMADKDFSWFFMEVQFKVTPTFSEEVEAENLRLVFMDGKWRSLHNKGCEMCGDTSYLPARTIVLFNGKRIKSCDKCNVERPKKKAKANAAVSPKGKAKGKAKAKAVCPEEQSEEEYVDCDDFKTKYLKQLKTELMRNQDELQINLNKVVENRNKIQEIDLLLAKAKKQRV
jgi:hypothetical protein